MRSDILSAASPEADCALATDTPRLHIVGPSVIQRLVRLSSSVWLK